MSFTKVIEKHGPEAVFRIVSAATAFAEQFNMPPGNALELLASIPAEKRSGPVTARELMALFIEQYAKKLDEAMAQADAEEGETHTVDLSPVDGLWQAAQEGRKEINPASLLPASATLQ
jgi:hypothetical protein